MPVKESKKVPMDPQKVERIMSVSLTEFAHHGYQGTKTDNIAKQANVSKGIIFRYYGNKGQLYLATIKFATEHITNVADYSVWQNAHDLDEMIVNATKYKIQLQLQFPDEFKILLDAYAGVGDAPAALRQKAAKFYANETNDNLNTLVEPVLNRLPVRSDIDRQTIQNLMVAVFNQVGLETKAFMKQHPDADLTDFDEIINHVRQYMDILEHGFLTA